MQNLLSGRASEVAAPLGAFGLQENLPHGGVAVNLPISASGAGGAGGAPAPMSLTSDKFEVKHNLSV